MANGSHATDLAAIPAIALKRVEVLRDGAAAQYGSDAVAGVMNFVLKDAPDSGTVEARWGKYYAGDGDTNSIAANLGVPLDLPFIQSGFANISFEYGQSAPTVRANHHPRAATLIAAGNKAVAPRTQFWGAPEFQYDYKLFGNLGMKLNSRAELYAFGNYAQRKIEGGFYYRSPNKRDGVFSNDGGKTIRVANLDRAQGACPDNVPTNPGAAYADVIAGLPSHCFMFNEKFPGGFTPRFGGTVRDWSGAVGIRGEISDWHYDLSAVLGQHSTEFFMKNTINPQLASQFYNTVPRTALAASLPTSYKPGTYTERDRVINLDFSRSLPTTMLPSPLNIGLGLEYPIRGIRNHGRRGEFLVY